MEKHSIPNLPTIDHVLEDIADNDIVSLDYPLKLSLDDDYVQNAYTGFYNCKLLEKDLLKSTELKQNLEELKTRLEEKVVSIYQNK